MTIRPDAERAPFVPLEAAIAAPGLRLVTTEGIPGPWVEAAKGILHVKGIDHVRVRHRAGEANIDLVAWTGINNAPVAVLDDELPRAGWSEILVMAERIAPDPALIPADERGRARLFGMAHALCGEDGFGWNKRLLFFARAEAAMAAAPAEASGGFNVMRRKYGAGDASRAYGRVLSVMAMLSDILADQARRGSGYLIGDTLTALDIYSACFTAMIRPLPEALCPMSDALRATYTEQDPVLVDAAAAMLDHRDRIYEAHLELPMRL